MRRPPVLTKQLFLLSSVKTSGIFFQIFVAFSEKLDFNHLILPHLKVLILNCQIKHVNVHCADRTIQS